MGREGEVEEGKGGERQIGEREDSQARRISEETQRRGRREIERGIEKER